jgi:hypothetical protein
MAKRLWRGYRRRDAEKRRRLLFHPQVVCTSKIAPNQCPAFARRGPLTPAHRLVQETGRRGGRRV